MLSNISEHFAAVVSDERMTFFCLLNTVLFFLKGEPCSVKLVNLITDNVAKECQLWNLYGPAEATIGCTLHLIDRNETMTDIPMGTPIQNYQFTIRDEFTQTVMIGKEGELLVGGVGVFAGYLGRDDLTAKALVEIDGEIFYRTGDLVRLDNNGLLHYLGRQDHQIKLHGQRIELEEIERCLLSTSISACVVIKWGDDLLVAYVQSSQMNEEQLRQYCQSHLPSHMIPAIFMVLEKLPLNANGKIDRKRLPPPDLSSITSTSPKESDAPRSQLEEYVRDVWYQVLRHQGRPQHIPTTASFFSIGGHSLLFIELYHRYQSLLNSDSNELSIASFLQQPTIVQHAKLLQQASMKHQKSTPWLPLHINEGKNCS